MSLKKQSGDAENTVCSGRGEMNLLVRDLPTKGAAEWQSSLYGLLPWPKLDKKLCQPRLFNTLK
jgi:hypothetical protein